LLLISKIQNELFFLAQIHSLLHFGGGVFTVGLFYVDSTHCIDK